MRRSNFAIVRDILEAAEEGKNKTHLVNVTRINFRLFKSHTKPLLDGGFLEKSNTVYKTTPEGHELALKISNLFKIMGLDYRRNVLQPNGEPFEDRETS